MPKKTKKILAKQVTKVEQVEKAPEEVAVVEEVKPQEVEVEEVQVEEVVETKVESPTKPNETEVTINGKKYIQWTDERGVTYLK